MIFYASLSLVASTAFVTLSTSGHFFSPYIFQRCFTLLRFPSIIPVVTKCSSFPLLMTWTQKKLLGVYVFYFMSDRVSASRNTVSFDFFAVHEIRSILRRNHIFVASSFFCTCFGMERERSWETTHPCLTRCFIFLNELIALSTRNAAVCSQYQYMFLITRRCFPFIFNFVN